MRDITRRSLLSKVPDVYTIYWPFVLQHGGSILGSVILCGTFRRISQLWENAHTLNLENSLLYLSSRKSQFFLLYPLHSFWFYFDSAHTPLWVLILARSARSPSFDVRIHRSSNIPIASFIERGLFIKIFCQVDKSTTSEAVEINITEPFHSIRFCVVFHLHATKCKIKSSSCQK